MSYDLIYPNISANTEKGQIEQIRSYLYQFVDQLKWALNSIESSGVQVLQQASKSSVKSNPTEEEVQTTFNSIKSLIIKSADIVESYYEEFNKKFSGSYVAQSDFGTFIEQTEQSIEENSTGIEQTFAHLQGIITDIAKLEYSLIEANAHLKSGLLFYDDSGTPIYGLEVGQRNEINGVEVFNKYARFTSDRLSFYDKNDTEVAYISDYKLYITNVQIMGTLTLGRFVHETSNGLVIKWE